MKKRLITLTMISSGFALAGTFNVIVSATNNDYNVIADKNYTDTGNTKCNQFTPEVHEQYKGTSFSQVGSECQKEEVDQFGDKRWTSIDNLTTTEIGTLVLANCKTINDNGYSRGNDVYAININGTEQDAYCNMTLDGGGWTLAATMANDGKNYWYWDNRARLSDNSVYGSVSNKIKDYKGAPWNDMKADSILLAGLNESKALRYDSVLNNQTLKSIYPSGNVQSQTFTADNIIGSWWRETRCDNGTFNMRTMTPDSDNHGWNEASVGFVWQSMNNNGTCWDDTFGGLSSGISGQTHHERHWGTSGFYKLNVGSEGGMFVFIR